MPSLIVVFAKVFHAFGLCHAVVFACHMIGHEIHHHLQSGLVSALNEGLPLCHSVFDLRGQVGINVVVVADGVR